MKRLLFFITILLLGTFSYGQKLFWTSQNGGDNQNGAIISYDLNSSALTTEASVGGNFLRSFYASMDVDFMNEEYFNSGSMLVSSYDDKIYAVNEFTNTIALKSKGLLYRIDPSDWSIEAIHTFTGNSPMNCDQNNIYSSFGYDLRSPGIGMIEVTPGVIYGLAIHGGQYDKGGIWKYEIATNKYTMVASFDNEASGVGYQPKSPMIVGPGGHLYGVIKWHQGNEAGHLYKLDINTGVLSYVHNLDAAGWAISDPIHQIVYNPTTNKIYGTKKHDPALNAGGGVYTYDFDTQMVTNESYIFTSEFSSMGAYANGICHANDGYYYFTTQAGGANDKGTLIKYSSGGSTMVKVHDFSVESSSSTTIVSGSKIYGTYEYFYAGKKMFWSYDVLTGIFHDFLIGTETASPGYMPKKNFVIYDGKLISDTNWGGDANAGFLISYDLATDQLTTILDKTSVEGRSMVGEMMLEGDTLYAFTSDGGKLIGAHNFTDHGQVLKYSIKEGTLKVDDDLSLFMEFSHNYNVVSNKIVKSSNDNYYLSKYSMFPLSFDFTIQKATRPNTSKANYIHEFHYDYGQIAPPIEVEAGKMIIGNIDSIFLYNEVSGEMNRYTPSFDPDVDGWMHNNLTLASNGKVYGTTRANKFNDPSKFASIYSIDPSDMSSALEVHFPAGIDEVNIGLVEYNGKLYGNTLNGGDNDHGYIFSYDISTKTYDIEYSFDASVDGGGFLGQWTVYNNNLYSVSYTGGANNYGTLVKFDPSNSTLTVLEDLTLANGRAYKATPVLYNDNSLSADAKFANALQINIYPNPVEKYLNLNIDKVDVVKVFNINGQIQMEAKNTKVLDVSDLKSGLYMIRVENVDKTYISKFLKK